MINELKLTLEDEFQYESLLRQSHQMSHEQLQQFVEVLLKSNVAQRRLLLDMMRQNLNIGPAYVFDQGHPEN